MPTTSLDLRRADAPIDYLERAREIAPMLAAASDEIEESRQLPQRVVEALIERGVNCDDFRATHHPPRRG